MSVNQPSRLFISTSDSEWTYNTQYGGQNTNYTLPEQIINATGIDLARAVIPTTLYNIPDYQNKFYFSFNDTVDTLTLTNNQQFDDIPDLITQLNTDATAQSKPLSFAYNTTTRRIVCTTTNTSIIEVNQLNQQIPMYYAPTIGDPPTIYTNAIIPIGQYTKTTFLSALGSSITNIFATVPGTSLPVVATASPTNVITLTVQGAITGSWYIGSFSSSLSPAQISAVQTLLGTGDLSSPIGLAFSATFPNPANVVAPIFKAAPDSAWINGFALNTRLGFKEAGQTANGFVLTGTFLPNILRTRVIYICTNLATNDTLAPTNKADSIRAALAKVPVNSTFGGMTVFQNNDFNFCTVVAPTIQNVELYLLDEELQPYTLAAEETAEFEFVLVYKEVNN